jgi:hypothetical protein
LKYTILMAASVAALAVSSPAMAQSANGAGNGQGNNTVDNTHNINVDNFHVRTQTGAAASASSGTGFVADLTASGAGNTTVGFSGNGFATTTAAAITLSGAAPGFGIASGQLGGATSTSSSNANYFGAVNGSQDSTLDATIMNFAQSNVSMVNESFSERQVLTFGERQFKSISGFNRGNWEFSFGQ